jgi:hypothetical protein
MHFWWVNQNQTFRQERSGGYLWSPKRNANGARNPFYEFMREVAPGDLFFAFEGAFIRSIGVIQSYCYECPKPAEFGTTGPNWEKIGWKADVYYHDLMHQVRPTEHMDSLAPHLPNRYSPLQTNGHGMQGVYLTSLPENLALAILDLIGHEARQLMKMNLAADTLGNYGANIIEWEEHLRAEITADSRLAQTDKDQLIIARRGQGKFRECVQQIEMRCRVTHVDRPEHLRASHCKPWRDSSNEERLDGENGLLLTPSVDHLFDRGFISFEDGGRLLVSPVAHEISLRRMGIPTKECFNAGSFTEGQRKYLDFHRNSVFLQAVRP